MGNIRSFFLGVIITLVVSFSFILWRKKKFEEEMEKFINLNKNKFSKELKNFNGKFPELGEISSKEIDLIMRSFKGVSRIENLSQKEFKGNAKDDKNRKEDSDN